MHYPFHLLATDHNDVAAFVCQKVIYFISNGKVTPFEAHKSVIKVVQFSNDGKFLATAAEDKTLKIWKINKTEGKIELQLLGELNVPKQVSSVAFSFDSKNLFAADRFGDVIRIDVPSAFTQLQSKVVLGHVSNVTCLCIAKRLISGDRDERIRVSSICLPADIVSFCMGHEQFITSVKAKDDKIISASGDGTVRYWNGENGEEIDVVKLGKEQKEEERLEEEEQERKANPNAFHELIHTRSKPITFIADMTKDGKAFVFVEGEPKLYLLSFGEKINIEKAYDLPAIPLSVIACGNDDFIVSLENGEFFCSENAKKCFDVHLLPKLADEEKSNIEKFINSIKLVNLRKRFIDGKKHDGSDDEDAPEDLPENTETQRDSKKLKME